MLGSSVLSEVSLCSQVGSEDGFSCDSFGASSALAHTDHPLPILLRAAVSGRSDPLGAGLSDGPQPRGAGVSVYSDPRHTRRRPEHPGHI